MSKLKACFHCGSKNIGDWCTDDGIDLAGCKDCGIELPFDEWNTRPIESAQSALILQLGEVLGRHQYSRSDRYGLVCAECQVGVGTRHKENCKLGNALLAYEEYKESKSDTP